MPPGLLDVIELPCFAFDGKLNPQQMAELRPSFDQIVTQLSALMTELDGGEYAERLTATYDTPNTRANDGH